MANILGTPFPKEDIVGSMVGQVYHENKDLHGIIEYCERDVITAAQVFLRLRNAELLTEDQILHILSDASTRRMTCAS